MLRTEALTKISSGGNKKVIVTYPEAIFEKVVLSKTLSQNIIHFKQGDTIKVDELLQQFELAVKSRLLLNGKLNFHSF